MKALGLLLGAGVLALAAGQADATISLYIGDNANGTASLVSSDNTGKFYYTSTIPGSVAGTSYDVQVTATGAPKVASPQLLSNSIDISSSAAGSLYLYVVQDNVSAVTGALTSSFSGTTIQNASATLSTLFSATNPFASGALVATQLARATFDQQSTGFDQTNSLNGVTQPFYEVAKYAITFKGTGQVNTTVNLNAGAVPEPASWAMMLAGFGLMGFVLRQRRRATVSFG